MNELNEIPLSWLLCIVQRFFFKKIGWELRGLGITVQQLMLLHLINEEPGLSITEYGNLLKTDRTTMCRNVDNAPDLFVRADITKRKTCSITLKITSLGASKLKEGLAIMRELENQFQKALGESSYQESCEQLAHILSVLELDFC